MENTKKILLGLGIAIVGYFVAKKLLKKDTLLVKKSSADGIDYEDLGDVSDIYATNDDNYYSVEGEYYSAEGDFMSEEGDFYDADGDYLSAEGEYLMADGEYMSADGVGKKQAKWKTVVKKGRKVRLRRSLENWRRKLMKLEKAKSKAQSNPSSVSGKMKAKLDIKIAEAKNKIAKIENKLNNPANQ